MLGFEAQPNLRSKDLSVNQYFNYRRISSTDALNQTQTITYDRVDNIVATTDRLGQLTTYHLQLIQLLFCPYS
jgi:YD repeat-containing protein